MKQKNRLSIVLSCEHATNAVPARYRRLFNGRSNMLASHRGWDPGTLNLGRELKKELAVPLFATTATRLLVEVNRSLHHRNLFSEFTRGLDKASREEILDGYYWPHRNAVEQEIQMAIKKRRTVLHLSLHSFTSMIAGVERNAEIGLLYDSRRKPELKFCDALRACFRDSVPEWRVRRNYPYLGRADGFTTHLRRNFPANDYLGIELEVNQALMTLANQKATITKLVRVLNNIADDLTVG